MVLVAYLLYAGGLLVAYLVALCDIFSELIPTSFSGGSRRQPASEDDAMRPVLLLLAAAACTPGALLHSLRQVAVLSGLCMAGVFALTLTLGGVCFML